MRVIVCGGRKFMDKAAVYRALDELAAVSLTGLEIIEGGQRLRDMEGAVIGGADWFAHCWAIDRGAVVRTYRAEWARFGARAGPIRNSDMLNKERPARVVALPGGKGTADMVKKARAAGVIVDEVKP